jgi:putative transposase
MLDWRKGAFSLARSKHTAEQIIDKLRQAEVALAQGVPVGEVARRLGVAEQTYYRWRKEYGGLSRDQARRLRELEGENTRLKKLVADLSLDNAILREVAQGNF